MLRRKEFRDLLLLPFDAVPGMNNRSKPCTTPRELLINCAELHELEKAERWETVDLMTQNYTPPGAVEVTKRVLKKINRSDLVLRLEPKGQSQKDKNMRRHLFKC